MEKLTGELSEDELDNVTGGVTVNDREYRAVLYNTLCFNGQFLFNPLRGERFERDDDHSMREHFRESTQQAEGAACCVYCLRLAFDGATGYCELSGK